MANMNFGVNILPKANNTYTLGNSDYKWNIFANSLNGVSLSNIITDIQIDGTSIVSNNIATIPAATSSTLGLVKLVNGGGLALESGGSLKTAPASDSQIKAGTESNRPIVPSNEHTAVFYGLAKAAGDSTQSASSNTVGTYTSQAQSAIRNMLAAAPKSSPFFTGAISLGRYHNNADQSDEANTIGFYSIAVGNNIAATGEASQAFGQDTYAVGQTAHAEGRDTAAYGNMSHTEGIYTLTEEGAWASHAEGSDTIANTPCVHVGGQYNSITDLSLAPTWTANTSYAVGDIVKHEETNNNETHNYVYRCITANSDATFDYGKWITWEDVGDFAEIIGNGGHINDDPWTELRSNARALDWQGNEYLNGDLYIHCNNDSSGGTSITEALNKKISVTSDTVTGNPCTFNSDVEDMPLKSIKLKYEFSQSGSGDPSPTNIRSITGISDFFIAHAKKNMATLRGYSATTASYNEAGNLSNSYGTTLSTIGPENSVVITQSQYPNTTKKSYYTNGFFSVRTDNLVDGQNYDISFKVTNITNNPLNASLSDIVVALPTTSTLYGVNVDGDVIKFTNFTYRETSPKRACFFIYNCGMSFTLSEFMITPANTNDGIYEPYEGTVKQYTFPALGKNLCPPPVKGISVNGNDGFETTSATRATTDYIPVDFATNSNYRFSGMPSSLTMWVSGYNANREFVGRTSSDARSVYTISSDKFNQGEPTHTGDVAFIRLTFSAGSGASIDDVDSASIQLEVGDTATAYEPYCNTVYGGSLDLNTGILTVEWEYQSGKWGNIKEGNAHGTTGFYQGTLTFQHDVKSATSTYLDTDKLFCNICDRIQWEGIAYTPEHMYIPTSNTKIVRIIGNFDDDQVVEVLAQLATPIIIQFDPEQIKTFKGTNTIWANTNGSIEIENHIDLETIKEYADNVAGIQDVQINGTSILNNKIANIPIADTTTFGVMKIGDRLGLSNDNKIYVRRATADQIKAGTTDAAMISAQYLSNATFYGLAKAAGDSTQSASSNAVGVYTDSAKTAIQNMLGITTMTGATSSVAGTAGYVPAPATTDVDKFLAGDGTYKSGGLPMVILSYGNSTWAEFEAAYNNNVIVYCRASSNANPATGSQTRMAFMAYVNNATTPTEVEFQYYRSMSSHSATAMGDQVFVYKLTKTGGWSVTTRDASIKQIKADTGTALGVSWSSNVVTLTNTMTADDMPMSSSDATTAKAAIDGKININQGVANAGKFLVVNSSGNVEAITLQAWQGGNY